MLLMFVAFDSSSAQEPALRGMKAVRLSMPTVQYAAESNGPDSTRLKSIAELRLRREGIRVEPFAESRIPSVWVNIEVICVTSRQAPFNACSVTLSLRDIVQVVATQAKTFATIWTQGRVVLSTSSVLGEAVEQQLGELFDAFLADWYAENPR